MNLRRHLRQILQAGEDVITPPPPGPPEEDRTIGRAPVRRPWTGGPPDHAPPGPRVHALGPVQDHSAGPQDHTGPGNGDHPPVHPDHDAASWEDQEDQPLDLPPVRRLMPDRGVKPDPATHVPWDKRERAELVPDSVAHPLGTARYAASLAWWTLRFHLLRVHIYLARNLMWAPNGAWRLSLGAFRWWRGYEYQEQMAIATEHHQRSGNATDWRHLEATRHRRTRTRGPILGAVALAVLVTGYWLYLHLVLAAPAAVLVIVALGFVGRPMDRPWIESARLSGPKARSYTAESIAKALLAAQLCRSIDPNDDRAPQFPPPGLGRDNANRGWEVTVDLPGAVTAEKAMGRRQELAAALRVDEAQLYLQPVRGNGGHAGRLRMYICDYDPHGGPPVPSPLNTIPQVDFWQPIPFGINERGQEVRIPLVWCAMLIGALPRMGKTFALRLIIAAAALDPFTRILLWDGKGGADHMDWAKVCHGFGVGSDDATTKALLDHLNALVRDMEDRYARLRGMDRKIARDGKLTKVLSHDPREKMPLTLVAIDEFQEYIGNRAYGPQILDALITLAKLGPAAGIMLVLATQRPSAETIPTELRDVIGIRFAMRVMGWQFSEMVLGSGTRNALGLDASRFTRDHLGVGILLGTGESALAGQAAATIRTHLMDLVDMEDVAERARALREDQGTLTGVAAGEEDEALSDRVLEHVLVAFGGDPKVQSEELLERMRQRWPDLYDTWEVRDLAGNLGRFEVPTSRQVWRADPAHPKGGTNQRGFHYEDVFAVHERRQLEEAQRLAGLAPSRTNGGS